MTLRLLIFFVMLPFKLYADNTALRQLYNRPPAAWPAANLAPTVLQAELTPLPVIPPPATADARQKYALGEKLFHDPILSEDRTTSCASCHEPRLLFADSRRTAIGVHQQQGNRNTPAIYHIALWDSFFWDGRASTAEQQATEPIENPLEMNLPIAEALARLNQHPEYPALFKGAFNQPVIDQVQLAKALVAFQSQITVPRTTFDRFLEAAYSPLADHKSDITAELTDQQLKGLHLFRTKARCINCHSGPLLSDNQFHVTGLHFFGRRLEDLGRYEFTKDPADSGKFRTPALRAVFHTGPWMHNGLFTQFEGIVAFYNAGGARVKPRQEQADDPRFPTISPLLQRLELTKDEMAALTEFLKIL
ncbi:cytochrome c peroxidase [Chromatiaceae bacterium AAb-1]|nr:cytochrome c peroxidase [Chromatiaceae bacterium AAb-1]